MQPPKFIDRIDHGVIWTFVLVGWLTFGISTSLFLNPLDGDTASPAFGWTMLGALLVVALGLWVEFSRDFHGAVRWVLVISLTSAALLGVIAYSSAAPSWTLLTSVFAFTLVSLWCVHEIFLGSTSKEPWPNVLREKFGTANVSEIEGVQLVVSGPLRESVGAGGNFDVTVFLQNCWDAPRRTNVSLKASKADVVTPGAADIELAAGEVVEVKLTSMVDLRATGKRDLRVQLHVTGRGGQRIRRWRAADARPISPLVSLFAVFGGLWVTGGGLKPFQFSLKPYRADVAARTPSISTKTVWRPRVTNL